VKQGDLIVATSGRAFWILDDLALIRQYNGNSGEFKVYKPEDAILGNWRSQLNSTSEDFKGTHPFIGVNPANGVVIYYQLPKTDDSVIVTMEIKDAAGKLVRQFSSKKDASFKTYDGGPPPEPVLSNAKGINRFVWDMRYATMPGVLNAYIEASYRGHKVSPGTYSITIKYDGKKVKQKVQYFLILHMEFRMLPIMNTIYS
jgi:hypothetical protein